MVRITAMCILIFALSIGMSLAESSDRKRNTPRDRYEKVIKEIETKKKRQRRLQKEEKSLLGELDRLARTVSQKNTEIKSFQKELAGVEKTISAQEQEMSRLNDQISLTQKRFESRVAALYKISKVGPWVFLLSGENYGDFVRMSGFLYSMIDHDVHLLATYENQLERKGELQKELTESRERLKKKQRQLSQRKREIEALTKKRERSLRDVRAEKTASAKLIAELTIQAEQLESLVKRVALQKKIVAPDGSDFGSLRGKLPLPVAGKLEEARHGSLRGILLRAPFGETVRAVHSGRVVYADWFKGYGNLLIVDHGDKFHTVMGNVSDLLKQTGDWVETGEPVAKVGDTGSFGRSALYFEIRRQGISVDPLSWFSRQDRVALK